MSNSPACHVARPPHSGHLIGGGGRRLRLVPAIEVPHRSLLVLDGGRDAAPIQWRDARPTNRPVAGGSGGTNARCPGVGRVPGGRVTSPPGSALVRRTRRRGAGQGHATILERFLGRRPRSSAGHVGGRGEKETA